MLGKLETFSKVLGALLMPLMLFYLGHLYAERDKARADQERLLAVEREAQQAELIAADRGRDVLLSIGAYITSDEARKQLYGIALLEDMRKSRDVPEALVQIVTDLKTTTPSPPTSTEGSPEPAVALGAEVRSAAGRVLDGILLAPRLYIYIADEEQRATAQDFERAVEGRTVDGASIVVPGITRKSSRLTATELRYFKTEERQMAESVAQVVKETLGTLVSVVDLSRRYGDSTAIRPNHFELWFAPGEIPLATPPVAAK